MKYLVGVDESGTGAFAGPFTVAAYAIPEKEQEALLAAGATDSKAFGTDAARRDAAAALLAVEGYVAAVVVVPTRQTMPQRPAWRGAATDALKRVLDGLPWGARPVIRVDGKPDANWAAQLRPRQVSFVVRGDALHPEIGAASMLAKTVRNDCMLALAALYPQYGFAQNYGYGSAAHIAAIDKYGICPEHRRIQRLEKYFV